MSVIARLRKQAMRQIHVDRRIDFEARVPDVASDTDHRHELPRRTDAFAERILPRPVALGEGLAHQRGAVEAAPTNLVARLERATREDRNLHGVEIVRAYNSQPVDDLLALCGNVSLRCQAPVKAPVAHRHALDHCGYADRRQRSHLVDHSVGEDGVVVPVELVRWQRNCHRQEVRRIEPGRDLCGQPRASYQQTCAKKQHHRQRHLGRDEQTDDAGLASGRHPPPVPTGQPLTVGSRRAQRRCHPGDEGGPKRTRERERQHCRIDRHLLQRR